jgi:hypothetical protein
VERRTVPKDNLTGVKLNREMKKMAETKYGKYFIQYGITTPKIEGELRPVIARVDNAVAEGSYFYLVHWMFPSEGPGFGAVDSEIWRTQYGNLSEKMFTHPMAGHPPHIHKDAELLFHIGTDPNNPMDLGAEVQMYMGPEMERHTFTKSTVIWIPPNFIHAPWKPLKTTRPWIFIEVNQGPSHTEKSFRQLLPKELREATPWAKMWPDEGYSR